MLEMTQEQRARWLKLIAKVKQDKAALKAEIKAAKDKADKVPKDLAKLSKAQLIQLINKLIGA